MTIRPATQNDLGAITAILNHAIEEKRTAYDHTLKAADLDAWFKEHATGPLPLLVVENQEGVTAWGSLNPYRKGRGALSQTAEISFYVERSARGKGIGSSLVETLEQKAVLLGIKHLFGIILDDNGPSVNLMKKHGYAQWAHLPGIAHFGNETKGHIYMGKHL